MTFDLSLSSHWADMLPGITAVSGTAHVTALWERGEKTLVPGITFTGKLSAVVEFDAATLLEQGLPSSGAGISYAINAAVSRAPCPAMHKTADVTAADLRRRCGGALQVESS